MCNIIKIYFMYNVETDNVYISIKGDFKPQRIMQTRIGLSNLSACLHSASLNPYSQHGTSIKKYSRHSRDYMFGV